MNNENKTTFGLAYIQRELKTPKGQINSFGNYKYRSCEDILEAVKPLLHGSILVLNDEIVQIGDRYYIKATATLKEPDTYCVKESKENAEIINGAKFSVSAFAREPLNKKGMDESQITGAASSYARKYALNGLFCIDDTKDADATNIHGSQAQNRPQNASSPSTYVIGFGKYKNKKLSDIPLKDLQDYREYIEHRASEGGKELQGQVLEFVNMVEIASGVKK